MKTLIFDIETGPAPEEEIRSMMPAFDPESVKMGNLKDPEKRAEKLKEAKENYYTDAYAKAALNAWSGQVLAIGYKWLGEDKEPQILHGDEAAILDEFAGISARTAKSIAMAERPQLCGFNIEGFDLPFLARRCMKHDVTLGDVFRPEHNRYYNSNVIDLMKIWQCGNRQEFISLNRLAKFLGCEQKDNLVDGKNFYKFYEDPETQHIALKYLRQDVIVTEQVAEKLLPY